MSEAKLTFVPPTSPESEDALAHLRPDLEPGDVMYDMDPFALFHEIGDDLVASEDMTAEEIVVGMQILSGRLLNAQGLRNMLGWAHETIKRNELKATSNWEEITKSERMSLLFGVEVDFGEPAKEERIAV